MASSALMADFGRLPTNRKVLLFVVVGMLIGGLYYRFVYTSLAEDVDEARGSHEATLRTHATNAANLKRYEELRPEMDKLRAQLARNQAALPTEAEVPAFFETLERKVKESGVLVTKWTKRPEEPIESFVKVPVEIEISGTFAQIKRFFASLVQKNLSPGEVEERERIVSIDALVISQPLVRNREIILVAKFVAVTFRQEEKPVPGKPGSPATAPGTPPPLRRGSTPPASPASPAAVRARLEEAAKEGGEARVDRALGGGSAAAPGAAGAAAPAPANGADQLKRGM